MRVQDIGTAIAKRYWMVIALVLISTLVAAIVAQVQSPVYKVEIALSATAPANPSTKLPDAQTQLAYVALMPSIANYSESISVAESTSQRLANQGIDIAPEELLGKVSAMAEANSTSVKITVSDGSPTRVADIANAWGEVLELKTIEGSGIQDTEFKKLLLNGSMVFTNRAVVPEKPTQPKTFAYIGLGFFVGLLLGLALVILIEYFNPHFRSAREIEETLDIPVLGALPKEKGGRSAALLSTFEEGSRTWRAYAELRSGLILSTGGAPKSILATAATPFEAAPAVAANLAISIANTGRRTLLVDCDLTARSLSGLMDCEDRPGLSDALESGEDYRGKTVEDKIKDFAFLPAGAKSENSTDLLSLTSFEEELREQEGLYDKIVLYAPPLIGSMDAAVAAAQSEASLIIVDADRCTRKAADEAMHNLERLGVVPLGAVLANVKMKGRDAGAREREAKAPPPPPAARKKKKDKTREAVPPAVKPGEGAKPASGTLRAEPPSATREAAEKPYEAEFAARPEVAAQAEPGREPVEAASAPARADRPGTTAGRPAAGKATPDSAAAASAQGGAAGDMQQVKESVAEDFRRMGEKGAPIPKNWLRALNSDKADVRESASTAIAEYYQSFLRRYSISDENIARITRSIIRMMRREGEFASMSEEEAQRHLRQLLVDAGARFSGSETASGVAETSRGGADSQSVQDKKDEKGLRRQEKRRFRLDAKGGRKAFGKGRGQDSRERNGDEEGIDWE